MAKLNKFSPKNKTKTTHSDSLRKSHTDYQKISEVAYYLSEKRNFQPGFEQDDWFKAETIIKTS